MNKILVKENRRSQGILNMSFFHFLKEHLRERSTRAPSSGDFLIQIKSSQKKMPCNSIISNPLNKFSDGETNYL